MTETWNSLGSLDDEQVPHERLRARFHAGLAAYEARESRHWTERLLGGWWPQQPVLQMGLAAALALVGVLDRPAAAVARRRRGRRAARRGAHRRPRAARSSVRVRAVARRRMVAAHGAIAGGRRRAARARAIRLELERAARGRRRAARRPRPARRHRRARHGARAAGVAAAAGRLDGRAARGRRDPGIEAVRAVLGRTELDPTVREYLQMALNEVGAETRAGRPAPRHLKENPCNA